MTFITDSDYLDCMATPKIKSIEELVEALGGPSAIAAWLGTSQPNVSNWILRRYIPPAWHFRLFLECACRGLRVDWGVVLDLTEEEIAAATRVERMIIRGAPLALQPTG